MVRREDDQIYCDREARVKVYFNVSTPFVYNILTGQEKYNPTVGTKLDIIITGREQYSSTDSKQPGSSGSAATPTSTPPLPIYEWGSHLLVQQQWYDVTSTRKQTTRGLEFDRGDVRHHQHHNLSGGAAVRGTGQYLTDDLVHHGGSTKTVFTTWGRMFPPNVSQRLRYLDRPPTTEKPSGGGETVTSPNTFSANYSTAHYHWLEDHERQP